MILIAIGILITLYALIDFKKALCLYLFYQVFWHPTATLVQIRGLPTIIISMFMNMVFFIIYIFNRKRVKKAKCCFPLERPILLVILSYFVTCFFSLAGFGEEFSRAFSVIAQDFFLLWIMWETLETKNDIQRLEKGFIILFLFAGTYSLIEYIIKDNPLVNYKSPLNDAGIVLYSTTTEALTRGYRVVSLFEHPIGAGMTMALFVIYILVKIVKYKEKIQGNYKLFSYMAVALCLIGILLTKMRSCLLFLIVSLFTIVDFKNKRFYRIAGTILIFGLIMFPLFQNSLNIFLSLFSSKAQEAVGGSTLALRVSQFDAIFHLYKMSPIGGLGEKFENLITKSIYTQNALGYESIWFVQMTRHGITGVIANIVLAYYSIIKIPNLYKSKPAMFLALGYWVTFTMTTIPSFRMNLYYLLYFYFLKETEIYKSGSQISIFHINNKTRLLPGRNFVRKGC